MVELSWVVFQLNRPAPFSLLKSILNQSNLQLLYCLWHIFSGLFGLFFSSCISLLYLINNLPGSPFSSPALTFSDCPCIAKLFFFFHEKKEKINSLFLLT